jgi:antitoxin component of MazEF toxin-antitoxin module
MKRTAKKRGNAAAVRIPAEPLPVPKKPYRLDDLMERITAENVHREVDFGAPQGKEVC